MILVRAEVRLLSPLATQKGLQKYWTRFDVVKGCGLELRNRSWPETKAGWDSLDFLVVFG